MKAVLFDVVVVGAGAGGICAAVGAARAGARTLLIEAQNRIGGTGVFSPLGILCGLGPGANQNINCGFLPELYPHLFPVRSSDEMITSYNAEELSKRYQALVAGEKNLEVRTSTRVDSCEVENKSICGVTTSGELCAQVKGSFFIDGTANGNLAFLAGADFQQGRALDRQMQPATLTFTVSNIKPERLSNQGEKPLRGEKWGDKEAISKALGLNEAYRRLKQEGRTTNPKREDQGVLFFPNPDVTTLVFNHTRVTGIDPGDPESVRQGYEKAEKQIMDLWNEIKDHPALEEAELKISPVLGIREGRRIVGDYLLTQEDCFGEARFEDMVAACCYPIDIHNPEGGDTRMCSIPGSGYYHIPFRCLCAKGWENLLLGSRCISGTHEAHSSYRVMAPLTAIGQACGVAAALACKRNHQNIRELPVPMIRQVLQKQNQFVEGPVTDVSSGSS